MNDKQPLRIVIADDHPIFRAGLRRLLESESGYSVVGEIEDGRSVATIVLQQRPDILLLDYSMPGLNGLQALRELGHRAEFPRTIILTAEIEPDKVIEALTLGAAGVLFKSAATQLLFKCIRAVMSGQYWVDRGTTRDLVSALKLYSAQRSDTNVRKIALTTREKEIIAALMRGATNKQIARDLRIAEQTVKNHLSQLYERLGVSSRLGLTVVVRERGLT